MRDDPSGGDGRIRAVCFDMDGVVLDSEQHWQAVEAEEILPRVVPGQSVEPDEVAGMPYRDIYDYLRREYEVAVSKAEFVDLFDQAARDIFGERAALLPGFEDLVGSLRDRGVAVALVTSSPRHWLEVVFERFDLEETFDAVVSDDDISAPGKPDPAIYEHAADRLDCRPAETLAVEDSGNGIRAAHGAGATVVAFRFGGRPGDGPADRVAASPAELRETVLELVVE